MAHRGKLVAAVLLLTVIFFTSFTNTLAGEKGKSTTVPQSQISEKFIENLTIGLRSDNEGLKQSVLELSGDYKIEEMVWPLISQMKAEKNARMRILIVLTLYKIGNETALKAIKDLTYVDENQKVKRLGYAIARELKAKQQDEYSFSGK